MYVCVWEPSCFASPSCGGCAVPGRGEATGGQRQAASGAPISTTQSGSLRALSPQAIQKQESPRPLATRGLVKEARRRRETEIETYT